MSVLLPSSLTKRTPPYISFIPVTSLLCLRQARQCWPKGSVAISQLRQCYQKRRTQVSPGTFSSGCFALLCLIGQGPSRSDLA